MNARAACTSTPRSTQSCRVVYAQPLLWRQPGSGAGVLIVATEDDESTRSARRPARRSGSGRSARRSCAPPRFRAGISRRSARPVRRSSIRPARQSISTPRSCAPTSLGTKSLRCRSPTGRSSPGGRSMWRRRGPTLRSDLAEPARCAGAVRRQGLCAVQRTRGRCGGYHGSVVGVSTAHPGKATNFSTRGMGRRLGAGRGHQRWKVALRRHRQHLRRQRMGRWRGRAPPRSRPRPPDRDWRLFRAVGLAQSRQPRSRSRRNRADAGRCADTNGVRRLIFAIGTVGGIGGGLGGPRDRGRRSRRRRSGVPTTASSSLEADGAHCPPDRPGQGLIVLKFTSIPCPRSVPRGAARSPAPRLADRHHHRRQLRSDCVRHRLPGRQQALRLQGRHRRSYRLDATTHGRHTRFSRRSSPPTAGSMSPRTGGSTPFTF